MLLHIIECEIGVFIFSIVKYQNKNDKNLVLTLFICQISKVKLLLNVDVLKLTDT